ncbi:MAG: hypothetical protein V4773_25605, partial [Verrucomicrobiota bacterium]
GFLSFAPKPVSVKSGQPHLLAFLGFPNLIVPISMGCTFADMVDMKVVLVHLLAQALNLLPSLLTLVMAILAFVAWRRRRETGFLLLSIGLAINAVLRGATTLTFMLRSSGSEGIPLQYWQWIGWVASVVSVVGWWSLARKRNASSDSKRLP